ncbi:MAG: hypothetical protein LC795_17070 [Acidobacteria bacterium]|nr:hypothetical protein [Acidobacteriota bacterium]
MTNPRCPVCGHISRVGTALCEMCDTRLDGAVGARGAGNTGATGETSGEAPGGGYAGFGAEGEGFAGAGEEVRDGALPTDIPAPQFKGAGDVISPTLEVYRKHFLLVGLLVLVTTLPLVLLQYGLTSFIVTGSFEAEAGIGAAAAGTGVGDTVLYWLLTMLGNALLSGALAYAVVQIQRTGAARAGESLGWGLKKLVKVVAVTLISYVITYGIPLVVLGVLFAALGPVAFIALLLMILPWVVLMLTFSMAVPAAAIENRGVFESMTRSVELTKGHKGLIFLTYFLWWVVIVLLTLVTTWSFDYGGAAPEPSFAPMLAQMLVGGMLSSSMFVLTVYIFLGILNENRQGFAARAYTPGPEPAAR